MGLTFLELSMLTLGDLDVERFIIEVHYPHARDFVVQGAHEVALDPTSGSAP